MGIYFNCIILYHVLPQFLSFQLSRLKVELAVPDIAYKNTPWLLSRPLSSRFNFPELSFSKSSEFSDFAVQTPVCSFFTQKTQTLHAELLCFSLGGTKQKQRKWLWLLVSQVTVWENTIILNILLNEPFLFDVFSSKSATKQIIHNFVIKVYGFGC